MKKIVITLVTGYALALPLYTQASCIDTTNAQIVAPISGSTSPTNTPIIAGLILNQRRKPLKNKRVKIFINNRLVGTAATNTHGVWTYKLKPTQALSNGIHFVQAMVTNGPRSGSWTKGSFFKVQARSMPLHKSGTVSATNSIICFPFEGAIVNSDNPIMVGFLLDANWQGVAGENVDIQFDSITLGGATSDSNGIFTFFSPAILSEGSHTADVYCVESDVDLGPVNFVVDVQPPAAPTITAPAEDETLDSSTVVVSGTTEENASVILFMDDDTYGQLCYADEAGNWSDEFADLSDGPHEVTAQATDTGNNTGSLSSPRNFIVDTLVS